MKLATGKYDQEAFEQTDRDLPAAFDSTQQDLAEQVDRILVNNPAM
ncbi:hypothetical protein [Corynebacterium riegelii]|nr:hypothetical protein [Corynebacterium riegelii]